MKTDIHPTYYTDAKVSCACGNTFTVGSTLQEINVELCSNCHPFYTGKQNLVDTSGRVERFHTRTAKQSQAAEGRKGKKVKAATRVKKTAKADEK